MKKYPYWRGLRGVYSVNNGDWSDPELFIKLPNKVICVANYWTIENIMYEELKDAHPKLNAEDDNVFNAFLKENKAYIKELIQEIGTFYKTC